LTASKKKAKKNFFLNLLILARPKQWTKNLLVFAALLFSAKFLELKPLFHSGVAFVSFILLSASIYSLNDVLDAKNDRAHPRKKNRPVASRAVSPQTALIFSLICALTGTTLAFFLGIGFLISAVAYLILTALYSLGLKHLVLLDVLLVAAGFLIRAVAGALAISVYISTWLLLCTTFLALLLALAKRRQELSMEKAVKHRKILAHYSQSLLDHLLTIAAACAVMTYSLYAFDYEKAAMLLTLPFVLYGIFRYLYLVHLKNSGGEPEQVLLSDRPLQFCVAMWGLACACIIIWV
jgi:4-hydroxybenzoate polyprenyltransferase